MFLTRGKFLAPAIQLPQEVSLRPDEPEILVTMGDKVLPAEVVEKMCRAGHDFRRELDAVSSRRDDDSRAGVESEDPAEQGGQESPHVDDAFPDIAAPLFRLGERRILRLHLLLLRIAIV